MNEQRIISVLLTAGFGLTLFFCVTPIIFMLVVSFTRHIDFLSAQVPYSFTFGNFYEIFAVESLHFIRLIMNSFIVSVITGLLTTVVAGLAAYSITRFDFPAGKIFLPVTLVFSMFPQVSIISYLYKLMIYMGWINTYNALCFPYVSWTLPLALWVLTSYFSSIPRELDKAAMIDGCGRWKILYKVLVPVAKPGLFSAFLLTFFYSYNEFMFALILTTTYKARTIPVGIAFFEGLHGQIPWGMVMTASTIAIIPVMLLTAVFQRHIIQGLTQGAVKG